MIHTLTAYTEEIDEVEQAVGELLRQLNLAENGHKNSIAIVTCYREFIDSGVLKALSEALDFDVVGITTLASTVPAGAGALGLSLQVLTSDDACFACAATGSLAEAQGAPIAAAYKQARGKLPESPAMMLVFAPLLFNVGGDELLHQLDAASGGIPTFGTLTVDHNPDYSEAVTFLNGEIFRDGLVLALLSGHVNPQFYMAAVEEEKILKQRAIITASNGNQLQQVNGVPLLQYMQSIGLMRDGQLDGAEAIPFMLDYNDGTKPVARAIFALTEEGYAVCGGAMPVNATLGVGGIDFDDVLGSAKRITQKASGANGALMFSCVGRNFVLGANNDAELYAVQQSAEGLPFLLAYSGGEFCPMPDEEGRLINRFHNDTLVACAFV